MRIALAALVWDLALKLIFAAAAAGEEQAADPDFDTSVKNPAYAANGPRVLFDEAHRNFHTATGRYKPLADLITNDGYQIVPTTRRKVTAALLADYQIMIVSNALGAGRQSDSAFADSECDAIRDWVREGGALLLIADHYPMGHAAERLAGRFDVLMSKGMTEEFELTKEKGLAGTHPILRGRSADEEVRKVRTFTGQSIKGPPASASLLTIPDGARELVPDATHPEDRDKAHERSVVYPDQGVAFTFGKGRVVMLGEAGMLTAQTSVKGEKFGMNVPGIDNRQFALNVMHWLSGLLPATGG